MTFDDNIWQKTQAAQKRAANRSDNIQARNMPTRGRQQFQNRPSSNLPLDTSSESAGKENDGLVGARKQSSGRLGGTTVPQRNTASQKVEENTEEGDKEGLYRDGSKIERERLSKMTVPLRDEDIARDRQRRIAERKPEEEKNIYQEFDAKAPDAETLKKRKAALAYYKELLNAIRKITEDEQKRVRTLRRQNAEAHRSHKDNEALAQEKKEENKRWAHEKIDIKDFLLESGGKTEEDIVGCSLPFIYMITELGGRDVPVYACFSHVSTPDRDGYMKFYIENIYLLVPGKFSKSGPGAFKLLSKKALPKPVRVMFSDVKNADDEQGDYLYSLAVLERRFSPDKMSEVFKGAVQTPFAIAYDSVIETIPQIMPEIEAKRKL